MNEDNYQYGTHFKIIVPWYVYHKCVISITAHDGMPSGVTLVGCTNTAPLMLPPSNSLHNKNQGPADNKSQLSKVASSRSSTKQRQMQLELQRLDEERKLQEKEETSKREYLQKRFE